MQIKNEPANDTGKEGTFTSLIKRMKGVSQLKSLSEKDLAAIIQAGHIRRYPAKATIFHESDPCFGLCVLLKGEVHLSKVGIEGQRNIISIVKPVIMFNEAAVIENTTNPVTATAHKNTILWYTDCETFQYGLERFPKLGLGLLPILAKRNRFLISRYADLSFRPVNERVAIMLLEMSDFGKTTIIRKDNPTHDMAAYVATVPEVISRTLTEFRELGYIESSRRFIKICQPDKLLDLAYLEMHT